METQVNLFESPATSDKVESFGCCSRFRQCSDAGRCLIADMGYSAGCSYRKKLENGAIFYGKNANDFSNAEYLKFRAMIEHLPPDAQVEYFRLLVHFWFTEFAAPSVMWDSSPELCTLLDCGLCSVSPCIDRFLDLCSDKKLRKLLSSDLTYGAMWRDVRSEDKQKKTFLVAWIKENATPLLSSYVSKYSVVALEAKTKRYSYEYYYDDLRGKESDYAVLLPKKRDDFELFNIG